MTVTGPPGGARGSVLVLAEESRVALAIVRSLGRRGIDVDLGWCPPGEPVRSSRFLRSAVDVPFPDDPGWADALVSLGQYDLIVPATDAATTVMHAHRDRWPADVPVAMPDADALDTALDKVATWRLAQSLGVPVPRSETVETVADLDRRFDRPDGLLARPDGRFVVKPAHSVDARDLGKLAVEICDGSATAEHAIRIMLTQTSPVIVQEFVTGVGVGVEVLAHEGRVVTSFQHRRLHETTGFGSTYRVSEAVDPALGASVARMIEALGYTGVAMFEFRVDDRQGRAALLEINPRFWGSLPLTVQAGADMPSYLFDMWCTGRTEFPQEYRTGIRSRDLLNDVRWMWRTVRRPPSDDVGGSAGWDVNRIGRSQLARHVARMVTFRDRTDTFSFDDVRPARREAGRVFKLALGAVRTTLRGRS